MSGDLDPQEGIPVFSLPEGLEPKSKTVETIAFDLSQLNSWDSRLMVWLLDCRTYCLEHQLEFAGETLPDNIQKLIGLATTVPERETQPVRSKDTWVSQLGEGTVNIYRKINDLLAFVGECAMGFLRLGLGRRQFRMGDFVYHVQASGWQALPVVTLISLLMGMIIAFLGSVVLSLFRAEIYVSYLVGWGVIREMGAVMTGMILVGRTGAAFAAEIGSMQVDEEIDALKTLGISPIDFVVLPRLIALALMMPLLTIWANFFGVFGGMLVSQAIMDITPAQFLNSLRAILTPVDFYISVIKGGVFGLLIGFAGCIHGIRCGSSADAVGKATTSAVVAGITLIVIFNALIDWILALNGI